MPEARTKTIGLLGGMSFEATIPYYPYYRIINQAVREKLGGWHSARIVLQSLDFEPMVRLAHEGGWPEAARILVEAAQSLETAGADFLVLCTNTMHRVAPEIEAQATIPLLHIVDATAPEVHAAGVKTAGLLGTRFTMEEPFYRERFERAHGVRVLTPPEPHREAIHRIKTTSCASGG